jgi:hypothetical protein
MGIPISLLVFALGAVLAFAVTGSTSGLNIHAVGWILIVVSLVGLVLSLLLWDTWAGGGFWRRSSYYEPPPGRSPRAGYPGRRGRVVREDVEEHY